jgi:hypothetical protein
MRWWRCRRRNTLALKPVEAEENKARLTRRAAYLIHQVNPNIGLLRKETGNNVMGLSVDLILDRTNGEFADIASDVDDGDGFRRTTAVFIPKHDPALMPRWVQPTPLLREANVRFDAIDARLSSLEASLRHSVRVQEQTFETVTRALAVIEHLGAVPRP